MPQTVSDEQKTLGDIEVEHKLAQIQRHERSLSESMRVAMQKHIREKITSERIGSVQRVLVQMGAVIAAIFLVYIIFWRISGGYPLEGFFR